jgi:hypothetical protein
MSQFTIISLPRFLAYIALYSKSTYMYELRSTRKIPTSVTGTEVPVLIAPRGTCFCVGVVVLVLYYLVYFVYFNYSLLVSRGMKGVKKTALKNSL